jgi:hypothetical protein
VPGALLERVRGHYARKAQLELDLDGQGQDRATAEIYRGLEQGLLAERRRAAVSLRNNGSSTTKCSAVSSAISISRSFESRLTRRSPVLRDEPTDHNQTESINDREVHGLDRGLARAPRWRPSRAASFVDH